MRKLHTYAALVLACVFALAGCNEDLPTTPESSASAEAAPSASLGATASVDSDLTTDRHLVVFKSKDAIPATFAESLEALGGSLDLEIESAGAAIVSDLDADAARELARSSSVSIVEPEVAIAIPEPTVELSTAEANPDAALASPEDPSGAFFFPRQWNMRAIEADAAWGEGALGSSEVTVAILDTGIGYTHTDLEGLVDLDRSISFLPTDDDLVEAFFPGAHPIADLHYHGTHVAATVSSNAIVAAGVTSRTTLIGAKVCSVLTGRCPGGAIFAGIEHAIENDADIVNMSLGGGFLKSDFPGFVSTIHRLFNAAERGGVTVVVAAGNDAADLDHNRDAYATYCDTPTTICVSATGPTFAESVNGPFENVDALASYSNFGRSAIEVAAPGGNFSAVWAACSTFSLLFTVCQNDRFVLGAAGTSMASPHAAAVGALLVANGASGPAQVGAGMQQSADDVGQPGTDPEYGKGRVNALNASR